MCHAFSGKGVWNQNNNKRRHPAKICTRQELKKITDVFEAAFESKDHARIITEHEKKAVAVVEEDLKMKKEGKNVSCFFWAEYFKVRLRIFDLTFYICICKLRVTLRVVKEDKMHFKST